MIVARSMEYIYSIQDDYNAIHDKILELARSGVMWDDEPECNLDPDDGIDIFGVANWHINGEFLHAGIICGCDYDEFRKPREYKCFAKYLHMEQEDYLKADAEWRDQLEKNEHEEDPEYEEYQRLKAKFEP